MIGKSDQITGVSAGLLSFWIRHSDLNFQSTATFQMQLFPPVRTLGFVARHSCARRTQSTLQVLTLYFMNTTVTSDNLHTTRRATALVKHSACYARGNVTHQSTA
jgi:hypothetical protein